MSTGQANASSHYVYRIRGLAAAYNRSVIRLAKTTTTIAIPPFTKGLAARPDKPVPPGFEDLPQPLPQRMWQCKTPTTLWIPSSLLFDGLSPSDTWLAPILRCAIL